MNKEFDCVEMKRKGAERLQKKLAGLSIEEELIFWQERNKALKEEQKRLVKRKKRVVKV
ncbi:MAG: hypothetical protein KKD86_11430 [Bacteroidetes bacterium]|nr:hypothetical protein [Bacteroidota bacterium]MBU1679440.1 hypothetical protein [Bacteroidota bacterium]